MRKLVTKLYPLEHLFYRRAFILAALGLFSISVWSPSAKAQEDNKCGKSNIYSYSYEARYDYQNDTNTQVDQKITFRSLVNGCTIKTFSLKVGSLEIEDVKALAGNRALQTEVNKKENVTEIIIKFSETDQSNLARYGDTLKFNLLYTQKNLAEKQGQIWEISLPKISISEQIEKYDVTATIPTDYGQVHFMDPQPDRTENKPGRTIYYFSKEKLLDHGVVAAFGDSQIFDFELNYHLENRNLLPLMQEVALPPDTEYQRVSYLKVEPTPTEIVTDVDGNYLARYKLSTNQKLDIKAVGKVKITDRKILNNFAPLSESQLQKYLKPQKYWEASDSFISKKAKELKTVREIYNYVVNSLKYSYDRVNQGNLERLGALGAINEPDQSICMEFTDLFIALARAAGIPAREINGYAYTADKRSRPTIIGGRQRSDVLHSWPEYYDRDKKVWIQVDPTWGSTTGKLDYFNKLDTNHFVFVRKGVASDYPYPAGSYKRAENKNDTDVVVKFAETDEFIPPQLHLDIESRTIPSGFSNTIKLNLENRGSLTLLNTKIEISAQDLEILEGIKDLSIEDNPARAVLPFGKTELKIKIRDRSLFNRREVPIKVKITGEYNNSPLTFESEKKIMVEPFYIVMLTPIVLILAFLILIILMTTFAIYLLKHPRYLSHSKLR